MILRTKNRLADPNDSGLTGDVFALLYKAYDNCESGRGWTGRLHVNNTKDSEQQPPTRAPKVSSSNSLTEEASTSTDSGEDEPPLVVGPLELPDARQESGPYYDYIKVVSS